MGFWEIVWLVTIVFSTLSFTFMSIRVLYFGFGELKFMLSSLETEHNNNNKQGENV